ncbi:hypothetical protein ACEPAI_4401 [Sanghuangporus weigelae]
MTSGTFTTPEKLAQEMRLPSTWKLGFRQLEVANSPTRNLWSELEYNETDFRTWWYRKRADSPHLRTKAWVDTQRLARRIVIQILEKVQIMIARRSPNVNCLSTIAERCREVLLYHIILCYNLPPRDAASLQELFEYTVPIVYLVSEVVQESSSISLDTVDSVGCIGGRIRKMESLVTELRNRCLLLGNSISFDIHQFGEELKADSIFDFGMPDVHEDVCSSGKEHFHKPSKSIESIDRGEANHSRDIVLDSQIQSVDDCDITDHGKTLCTDAFVFVRKLEGRVLEEIGLRQVTWIDYETKEWRGDGKYSDVFEMKRGRGQKAVAVKIYKRSTCAKRLLRQARLWMKINHKHFAPLLGFSWFDASPSPQFCLVSELYQTNLKQLVSKYGRCAQSLEKRILTEDRRFKFLRDIVFALDYMHAIPVAHGALRASNVMITNEMINDPSCYAVLKDFGEPGDDRNYIKTVSDKPDLSSPQRQPTDYWLAPELKDGSSVPRVSKTGDVYAFGVTFYEVVYERDPYEGLTQSSAPLVVPGDDSGGNDEPHPQNELNWELLRSCWETADKRCNIQEAAWGVLRILDALLPSKTIRYSI